MIERCKDAKGLNEFALQFDWHCTFENADFENHFYFKYTQDEKIKAVFILIPIREGFYECHYLVDKSVRGKLLKNICYSIFDLFPDSTFYGFTPKNNKPALIMASLIGFKRAAEQKEYVLFVR